MALLRIIYRAWNDIPPWCKHRRAYMAQDAAFLRTPRKALISSGQEEVPGFTMYPTLWRADYWAFYLKVPAQHFTHVPPIVGLVLAGVSLEFFHHQQTQIFWSSGDYIR
ncbi:hypothetical protein CY34DRAFT_9969 [Suillus luteus UH-Slu-Lm8-n1]|uniref:Uncharacterized protein n=1 Tax=Suillus luteus UH-Slu-Lm8-n1 TaxID=930992 RepID=A0A0D0AWI8_9AGAM|nr:hypothetical protein CY34DRAFT_9969 [Suillus luteus UH-Slu-Lm8-n1]